jgi:hypothetical protein
MRRRGFLSLLGMSAAVPAIGVKAAASHIGLPLAAVTPTPEALGVEVAANVSGWWGSPTQLVFEARAQARYPEALRRFDHMKSWGHGFREIMTAREIAAERLMQRFMDDDEKFRAKVLAALLGEAGQ